MTLEHLFDADLRFRPGLGPLVSPEPREGAFVGSGDGTVVGPAVAGVIHWSNFETQGERLCGMNPAGTIDTDDGATIRFTARGWALLDDANDPRATWRVAGALQLSTDDARYRFVDGSLAVWEGRFDESSGRAAWHVYRSSRSDGS